MSAKETGVRRRSVSRVLRFWSRARAAIEQRSRSPDEVDKHPGGDWLREAEALVGLGRLDWGYADLYLRNAERALRHVLTEEDFRALESRHNAVPRMVEDARRAVQRGAWQEAEQLAEDALRSQRALQGEGRLLAAGAAVYGARSLSPEPAALAVAGAVSFSVSGLRSCVRELTSLLRGLAQSDGGSRSFYERRAQHFERLEFDAEEVATAGSDPAELREAALTAADAGNLQEMIRLARRAGMTGRDSSGRARAPRPSSGWVEFLGYAFPPDAVGRAAKLGLESVAVPVRPELNAYLSCACADRPTLPAAPLDAGHREPEQCTCGHACPPGVSSSLKSSLDALMVHPFVTSGGTRYLPWFGAETVLVETFREEDSEPVTGLLEKLGIPRRRGLPRLRIEDALLRHGRALCEELGVDPADYRLVCIPFDVYMRIAGDFGWGRREQWTHFDGYQVTRELHLQALVGGDVRFGGADDLCGVARHYDSDRITARFALVRRKRFEAREQQP